MIGHHRGGTGVFQRSTSAAPLALICSNLQMTSSRGSRSSVLAFTVSSPTPDRVGPKASTRRFNWFVNEESLEV
jgi:hypothetical protein